jgi:hypothetical protein
VIQHAHLPAPSAHSFSPRWLAAANCAPLAATLGPWGTLRPSRLLPSEESPNDRCILAGR